MRLFLILATSALLSCSEKDEPASENSPAPHEPSPASATTWPETKETVGGSYSVTLTPTKDKIGRNEHFSLDLSVEAKSRSGPLAVKVDADMPAHRHGMNTLPELIDKGDSRFQVEGMLFHMSGEWVIMVDVTSDGKTERASFPVQIE